MKAARLDNELKRIHEKFSYLWQIYGFHVSYFTRDYGMYYRGFVIGLETDLCKLVFEKESNSAVESIALNVGKIGSPVAPLNYSYLVKDGWYPLTGLVYWLSGVECERNKNVDQDLENVSQYLKIYIERVLDLFRSPADFDRKLEYYRNRYKENQISVQKIREERARLHALGVDSSLEIAIANLRGGQK